MNKKTEKENEEETILTSMSLVAAEESRQRGLDGSGHWQNSEMTTPSLAAPLQPGHPVVGPHREQNDPDAGSSGTYVHRGSSAGPKPWKSHPHESAQTGPIRFPRPPPPGFRPPPLNHEMPDIVPVGAPPVPGGR